jgi:hypothetical protein
VSNIQEVVDVDTEEIWLTRIYHNGAKNNEVLSRIHQGFDEPPLCTTPLRYHMSHNSSSSSSSSSSISASSSLSSSSAPMGGLLLQERVDEVARLKKELLEAENRFKCIICNDQDRQIMYESCGHLAVCTSCDNKKNTEYHNFKCPICNSRIKKRKSVFIS